MKILRNTVVSFLLLTLVTGIAYPMLVTGLAQAVMPWQAGGSLVVDQDRLRGSALIGQAFASPGYFWGRPSVTADMPYNGQASGGSNLGPSNPALLDAVEKRLQALQQHPHPQQAVPADLVTASSSGLDPHISPAAANWQVLRVAKARGVSDALLYKLVRQHTETPLWSMLGEPRVNVLALNRALDRQLGR